MMFEANTRSEPNSFLSSRCHLKMLLHAILTSGGLYCLYFNNSHNCLIDKQRPFDLYLYSYFITKWSNVQIVAVFVSFFIFCCWTKKANRYFRFGCRCEKVKLAEMNVWLAVIPSTWWMVACIAVPKSSNENRIILCVHACALVCSLCSLHTCGMNISNWFSLKTIFTLMAISAQFAKTIVKSYVSTTKWGARSYVFFHACFIFNWIKSRCRM